MAEIINLRTVRKRMMKDQKAGEAARRRILFGRTAAEKSRDTQQQARRQALLDGARLECDPQEKDEDGE
ncbi:DUF4169 family protein [Granulibacter bethesdensis]|uniref:DUF4169 family protein n=1 Tax=Granulibacter bethesdensis TaxID=364410 RepID=UPI00093444ED|nr:DUF4169 family protein [Granulibacter bethesdensis]